MSGPTRYGLLLPHFGEYASAELLVSAARRAEAYGFDSLWLRDHLVYRPHGYEGQDPTFFETVTTMAVLGAVTERIALASGSMILHRSPLSLAQQLSTASHFLGPNRLILGLGLGGYDYSMAAVGLAEAVRTDLFAEQVAVIRAAWGGAPFSFDGTYYQLDGVNMQPAPAGPIPIWYCGNSAAAVRRSVECAEGWMPGRITTLTFRRRVERLRELAEQAGKPVPTAGSIALVSPGRTVEEGASRVNMPGLLANFNESRLVRPPSGRFETAADIEGALFAGPPPALVEQILRMRDAGATHIALDLRYRFDAWDEMLTLLGEEVLPELRQAE